MPGSSFSKPSDVAWDKTGNIYVADGMGTNNRVAKFDKDGAFIKHWGSTGTEPGQFRGVKALAIDAQGDVYVADAGNKRIQVFDSEGAFKRQFANVGHAGPAHDVDAARGASTITSASAAGTDGHDHHHVEQYVSTQRGDDRRWRPRDLHQSE